MALVKCSDCGRLVSDSAFVCPHCGRPLVHGSVGAPRRNWEVGAIIAALIGLLALLVSGYTAWIQREQVRAQVWPHLLIGYSDPQHALVVLNKGVGPALIRSVEIAVDEKPRKDWPEVFNGLGLTAPEDLRVGTLSQDVLSPGETLTFMSIPEQAEYKQFRRLAPQHMRVHICFCSTLGECWMRRNHVVKELGSCPRLPPSESFVD